MSRSSRWWRGKKGSSSSTKVKVTGATASAAAAGVSSSASASGGGSSGGGRRVVGDEDEDKLTASRSTSKKKAEAEAKVLASKDVKKLQLYALKMKNEKEKLLDELDIRAGQIEQLEENLKSMSDSCRIMTKKAMEQEQELSELREALALKEKQLALHRGSDPKLKVQLHVHYLVFLSLPKFICLYLFIQSKIVLPIHLRHQFNIFLQQLLSYQRQLFGQALSNFVDHIEARGLPDGVTKKVLLSEMFTIGNDMTEDFVSELELRINGAFSHKADGASGATSDGGASIKSASVGNGDTLGVKPDLTHSSSLPPPGKRAPPGPGTAAAAAAAGGGAGGGKRGHVAGTASTGSGGTRKVSFLGSPKTSREEKIATGVPTDLVRSHSKKTIPGITPRESLLRGTSGGSAGVGAGGHSSTGSHSFSGLYLCLCIECFIMLQCSFKPHVCICFGAAG